MMKWVEIVLVVGLFAAIAAAFTWSSDYQHYNALINELMAKCGEPCL